MDFVGPVDHGVKLKESERRGKSLALARELIKLWDMKVTMLPIVNGEFGTVIKGLVQGLEDVEIKGRIKTIQITE